MMSTTSARFKCLVLKTARESYLIHHGLVFGNSLPIIDAENFQVI